MSNDDTLVVIPARGGSKGIPRKNIKKLAGKPLILYTVEAAREVFADEQICVSTDDVEIKDLVENTGLKIPFLRPSELATDMANTREVILHAIEFYENLGRRIKKIVLLQPTSPHRNATHIKEALMLYKDGIDMVVSVKETSSNPYFLLFEEDEQGFLSKSKPGEYLRRQDCPKVWEFNGAIYVINAISIKKLHQYEFKKVVKYIMDEFASHELDTALDWVVSESLFKV